MAWCYRTNFAWQHLETNVEVVCNFLAVFIPHFFLSNLQTNPFVGGLFASNLQIMVKSFAGLPCRLAVICLSAYLVTTVLLNFLTWLVQRPDWWLTWVEDTIQVLAHFLPYTLATYLPTYVFLYLHSSTLHNATLHIQLHYDCTTCAHCAALFCTEYLNTYMHDHACIIYIHNITQSYYVSIYL